jgi:ClpP class serine protease
MNQEFIGKISELFNTPLAIADGALSVFFSKMEQRIKDEKPLEMPVATYRSVDNSTTSIDSPDAVQTIMIIPVMDVIVKNNYPEYGLLGLRGMQMMLKEAMVNDSIMGVMFYGDCPGGTTSDLAETVDLVAKLTQIKPVGAYADGLMCSAFTMLTAPCSFIACTPKTSMIGNIGSRSTVVDDSGWLDKMGVKIIDVYGDLATDKDLGHAELIAGKPKKYKDMIVNPHNEMFVDVMKKYRPQIKDEALHGAVYLSEKAKEVGLVDMCCGFDEAIDYLIDMITGETAAEETAEENASNNVNNNMKKVIINVSSAAATGLKFIYPDAIVEDLAEGENAETVPPVVVPPVAVVPPVEVVSKADFDALKLEFAQAKAKFDKGPGAAAVVPMVTTQEQTVGTETVTALANLPHIKAAQEALAGLK